MSEWIATSSLSPEIGSLLNSLADQLSEPTRLIKKGRYTAELDAFLRGFSSRSVVQNSATAQPFEPQRKASSGGLAHYSGVLRTWQADPFYQELNQKIFACRKCGSHKIGFIPSYGMGFVPVHAKDMETFRPQLFLIADPPLNFPLRGSLPPSPRATMVSGSSSASTLHLAIGDREAVAAAQALSSEYQNYAVEAPALLLSGLEHGHFDRNRVLWSSQGRCFLRKGHYSELFGRGERKGPDCSSWLLEELDYVYQHSKPYAIFSFSSHFVRQHLGIDQDLDHLRQRDDLQWRGIPVRVTYHPYQWIQNQEKAQMARNDILRLYRFLFS